MQITTIGLDIAKNVFQVHGADNEGRVVLRRNIRRDQLLGFQRIGAVPPFAVASGYGNPPTEGQPC
jgi:transposase